jgi:hypothetical protein
MLTLRTLTAGLVASCFAGVVACGSSSATGTDKPAGARDASADTGTPAASDGGPAAYTSAVYSDATHWLCLPGKTGDVCHDNLDATVVLADGTTRAEPHVVATKPAIDCFYVYPTISTDLSPNSDLSPGVAEINVTKEQAARLTSVCDVYAPVYRQVTLGSLFRTLPAEAGAADRELPYSDVLDAWKHYLAHYNHGRPFVLAGHSQGSGVLRRLIQEQIEGDDALRGRLVSALLIGGGVAVPDGQDVGLDFKKVPVCHKPSDTGCVVAYSSFRATAPPPADTLFGKPRTGAGVAVCSNPAALGGGPATLKPYFRVADGLITLSGLAAVPTPFVTLPDFVRGECVARGGLNYMEITLLSKATDQRPKDVTGDITPPWGLHLIDMHLAMGDFETLVQAQAKAFAAR